VAPKPEDSLSPLARQLLAAERGRAEDELLKVRAVARAREAVRAHGRSEAGLSSSPWRLSTLGVRRLLRVALPAAALGLAGLAAAGVTMLVERPAVDRPPARLASGSIGDVAKRAAASHAARRGSPVEAVSSAPLVAASSLPPPRRSVTSSTRTPSARQYALELELLEPARKAIARGDYGAALEAVARHERTFPSGQLSEERSALRVRALWASGRRTEAQASAALFKKRYPRSGLLAWMGEPAGRAP
jgi:hypothetical protein